MRAGLRIVAIAAIALLAGGCMPASVTDQGRAINGLYALFFGAAAVVFVIVAGLITWSIFRYRYRGPRPIREASLPPQYHGNLVLEAIWTTLPILTVLGLFAATLGTLGVVQARSSNELNVTVTAFQWQWKFEYPDTKVTVIGTPSQSPVLVVPVGRTVHINLISADVNHAFYVPAFLFKQDAIPGHPNQFDFKVDEAGTYRGQCAEFCGVYHDRMTFSVRAVSEAEFSAWVQQQQQQQQATGSSAAPSASESAPPASAAPSPSASAS